MVKKILGAAVVFIAVSAAAASMTPASTESGDHVYWYSIVPPLLAIVLAFLTQHVIISLGMAVVVGAFLCHVPGAPFSIVAWARGLVASGDFLHTTVSDVDNLLILSFIPPIFMMIEVVIASGGFQGIIRWLLRWVNGPRSAQLATVLMGILCFIDDYANAIVVGSMMKPVTDRFRISREKLAFLVDATSAPVSGLAIISTWIAYEVRLFEDVGTHLGLDKTGYSMFFDALHYRFYCLLMLGFVVLGVIFAREVGPMKAAERRCRAGAAGAADRPADSKTTGLARNALIPLAALIGFHLTGLWIDGDGPAKLAAGASPANWTYWRDVISAARHSTIILACAAAFSFLVAVVCTYLTSAVTPRIVRTCVTKALKRALTPSIILILAWSLKDCCRTLETGKFLSSLLVERVSPQLFPVLLFIVASITSFATGTSWGTMAILIPTAIPVAFELDGGLYGVTTMISLGAVLDGAIFGDHCSPISDTTIISTVASDCPLMDHVRTQLPYSLIVGSVALLFAYLPAARGVSPAVGMLCGLAVLTLFLAVLRRFTAPIDQS